MCEAGHKTPSRQSTTAPSKGSDRVRPVLAMSKNAKKGAPAAAAAAPQQEMTVRSLRLSALHFVNHASGSVKKATDVTHTTAGENSHLIARPRPSVLRRKRYVAAK